MNALLSVVCLGFVALLRGSTVPGSQRGWQADVRIQSIEVVAVRGRSLNARILITSDNDGDARNTRLEILLPVGVGVSRLAPGCRANPVPGQVAVNAHVSCDLGDIPVRGTREVTIATSAPAPNVLMRVAAFVMSDTPDPMPSNNYAERVAP